MGQRALDWASLWQAEGDVRTTARSIPGLTNVLDRASSISILNAADSLDNKIVIVLHGGVIPLFAIRNDAKNKGLMHRAQSLSVGQGVEYRLCEVAARLRGFEPEHIHGFVTPTELRCAAHALTAIRNNRALALPQVAVARFAAMQCPEQGIAVRHEH